MAQQLHLKDGRVVDYLISGDKNGFPMVYIHGTPGAYQPPSSLVAACEKKGVKIISASRAGYGGSSRLKGRRTVDAVADLQALNEHLGVEKCLVAGWSGGGPHALACAARLPGCVAALCIAGCAPYDAEGLDWIAGQGEDNVEEFAASLKGEEECQKFCQAQRGDMLSMGAGDLTKVLDTILPEVDKKALASNPVMAQDTVNSFQEGLRISCDGWVDDDMACIKPWGFDISEIKVPVFLYQGSEDMMVPFAHGEWLGKHLPQEKLTKYLIAGEGHLSIFNNVERMVDELLAVSKA